MGHCERACYSIYFAIIFVTVFFTTSFADDRCKDESFCRAYCLSTNPDTVSARCGRDLASCICITPENHAVKVRFIEERTPVPPTPPTTPRPTTTSLYPDVQYVNSQSLPNGQYNYNGNGNSIANTYSQQPQSQSTSQRQQQSQMTPVLLECDASETSTRMCHLFCTMEIRAWYGLCNITSKACACFGIPLSAVQQEPIAAIFHSTAPVTPTPSTTPKPTYSPPRPGYQQLYPAQQYLQQQQQQQWRPLQPSNYQSLYNNNQYYPGSSPSVLNGAITENDHQEQAPVRSAASLFGSNGQPLSSSISTPDSLDVTVKSSTSLPSEIEQSTPAATINTEENLKNSSESPVLKQTRKKRSINDTPMKKGSGKGGKDSLTGKNVSSQGECSKYKCAISCKRNNYLAPDCEPQCIDEQCWCECFPRL